ncbi:MAG: RuvX/YqgF family protein, partial [Chloroflexota bacterium]|jgi:RNase H-fold protein (predicted Holliday junction resolvase)|nr:RuvX/YqgF family protein [Chloroflexota bacterium]
VVGLPLNMDGSEGGQAETARADAQAFLEGRRERIIFWDERLTTFEADRRRGGPQKGDDARAAVVLLEDYLRAREEDDCE